LKEFIETTLHQPIELEKYRSLKQLPLVLRSSYELYDMKIDTQHCLLAMPKSDTGLTELRRQQKRLETASGMYCVLYLKNLNQYSKNKMLVEGIPFILENRQVYMPFLGLLLRPDDTRELKACRMVSFLTQKLLLTALYQGWDNVTVTIAAERLSVSKMSITRCFDEIESLEVPVLTKRGRIRTVSILGDKKEQWEIIKPFMRSPVIREFYLEKDLPDPLIKSGFSALSEYSMLGDNHYPTYAITKSNLAEIGIRDRKQVPNCEEPGCIVQELGYIIPYNNDTVTDPLTTLLLMEKNSTDPRVSIALDEMLEEYVW
jgi:hypothetical protein